MFKNCCFHEYLVYFNGKLIIETYYCLNKIEIKYSYFCSLKPVAEVEHIKSQMKSDNVHETEGTFFFDGTNDVLDSSNR